MHFRVVGGTKINITKGSESDSIYLCIQGAEDDGAGDWCYTKEITSDCEVAVSEIGIENVTDFNNYCVWLEMKDNNTNLIYAKKVATSAVSKLNNYIDISELNTSSTIYGLYCKGREVTFNKI